MITFHNKYLFIRWLSNIVQLIEILVSVITFGVVRIYIGVRYFLGKLNDRTEKFKTSLWVNFSGMGWVWLWKISELIPCLINIATFGIIDVEFKSDYLYSRVLTSDIGHK